MAEDSRKLFVAGLPDSMTEDVLRQLFEATGGSVVEVSLPKDRATGRPRGFGFVTLATSEEAESARETLDGSMQGGRSISVRPFQAEPPKRGEGGPGPRSFGGGGPGGGNAPDRTLYVGNLPYDTTNEEVEELIKNAGAGPVVRVNLPMDADGRRRGFGFVTMGSADAAKQAIDALRGADVRGRRLVVNLAHPKGDRPPPREGGGGGGGGYERHDRGGGPPPSRNFGGPPSGGFNAFDGPAPPRKTFDERRRKGSGAAPGAEGEGRGGGGGGRRSKNWDKRGYDDWDSDD